MTTIAWDGQTMAADKGHWFGNIVVPICKVFLIHHEGNRCAVSGAGTARFVLEGIHWLAADPVLREQTPPFLGEDGQILLGNDHGELYVFEGRMQQTKLNVPFFAIGGGAEMAMGALAAGANAKKAVEIVIQYGPSAVNGVDVITPMMKEGW